MKKYLLLILLIPTVALADIKDIDFNNNNFYKGIKNKLPSKIIDDVALNSTEKNGKIIKKYTYILITKKSVSQILKFSYDKNSDQIIKNIYKKMKSLNIKSNHINLTDIISTNDYTIAKVNIIVKNKDNIGLVYFLKDKKIVNIILEPDQNIKNFFKSAETNNTIFKETYGLVDSNNIQMNSNIDYNNIVILHTYKNNVIVNTAVGFFIGNGFIATSFKYINDSLNESDIISVTNNHQAYDIKGLVDYNQNLDIAILKVNYQNSGFLKIDSEYSKNIYQVGTKNNFKLTTTAGTIIDTNNQVIALLPSSIADAGSPLFNNNGNIIGMTSSKFLESPITLGIHYSYLKSIQDKLNLLNYDNINAISLNELKNTFYTSKLHREFSIPIETDKINSFFNIGNLKETIDLKLIKASSKDNIVTFKYQTANTKVLGNLSKTTIFSSNLQQEGYKVSKSNIKEIYTNNKYNIILLDIFNYLLVIIEEK